MTQKESRSHLYMIWSSMKRRCENPNMPNYKYYGAKGIKVCGEWHSFPKFKEWAKANGYVDGLSLDRIDSSRDYEPDNCQWMTLSDNATKSLERIVTVDGVEGNVRAWAKLLDCSPGNISYHIYGKGVPVEEFIRRRARYGKNQRTRHLHLSQLVNIAARWRQWAFSVRIRVRPRGKDCHEQENVWGALLRLAAFHGRTPTPA